MRHSMLIKPNLHYIFPSRKGSDGLPSGQYPHSFMKVFATNDQNIAVIHKGAGRLIVLALFDEQHYSGGGAKLAPSRLCNLVQTCEKLHLIWPHLTALKRTECDSSVSPPPDVMSAHAPGLHTAAFNLRMRASDANQ